MPQMAIPSQMTLHVLAPTPSRGRTALLSTSRNTAAPSRVKTFFDELINIPAPTSDTGEKAIRSRRPRLIYLRDFPTLAPTSSTWYPPLLSAVRQRRVGPIARPSSPISNPMTIIFGITPPIVPPASVPSSSGSSNQGLVNMLMNRKPTSSVTPSNSRPSRSDWSEDETADKAREKRLKDRLRKWEKGDPELIDELPKLSVRGSEGESTNGKRPGVFVIGGSPGGGLPPSLDSILGGSENPNNSSDSEASTARFFRTSVLVPNTRSVAHERLCRTSRRREINEVTMRMGVGAVGGALHKMDTSCIEDKEGVPEGEQEPTTKDKDEEDMWHDWSNKVEVWSNVRQIADRALGSVVAATPNHHRTTKSNLEPTVVPWSAVHRAWAMQRSSHDLRKSWMKEAVTKVPRDKETEDQHDEGEAETGQESVDEVVERIKQDPDLEQHEQRLLACIVDAASMSTSFSQVHLPPHTIDSVRTIVSLPLLHPAAFQQGILKEHGMTGCLLFGPPGTGKTLVVRALAKEAGCRMMTISPSDVMDMYVGEGEKLVRAVFSLARRLSPCVVFLDEIDALFGARMSARESGGAFAHRGVITEFMQEMDGLKTSKDDRVIVIGATNRPFDLDDAVLRRLPRRLLVDLPGEKEREGKWIILRILLREETLSTEVDLNALAKRTESFSGSDLKHLCVSAALDAVKEHVEVPWKSSSTLSGDQVPSLSTVLKSEDPSPAPSSSTTQPEDVASEPSTTSPIVPLRTLHLRHFTKALKEITPSSSESLGSLSDLRKWNEEFGEGRKDKKRQQVWGKGKFGFINKTNTSVDEGRVAVSSPTSATSTRDIV
ncbi:hypothetical protein SERLADRAFT_363141 [Serpula lacrymans var. lacrymans S7.9]|nr:uncharacterized protein SERLADRAFT_363141 [Serpula lacrymans var. lacrymans S7.9]EGO20955.1 hypothetical protein SERLADRAFT_363141 [Serpula lacrymans var. lacrymans S7.9]